MTSMPNPMSMGPINPLTPVTPAQQTDNSQAYLAPPVDVSDLPLVIGESGTMRYGGFFHEDYEPAWADNWQRVEIVETMRRGDARVAQLLKAVKAPMLAAEFDVECGSDDPRDQEILEFVRKNLFEMKGRTFKKFFREALTCLDFGYSVFEQLYEQRDGKIWLKDLAPRIQHSILKFKLDNGQRGVVQVLRTDEAKNTYPQIPINKCLIFTNDMEGDDITGISLLRYCFKHWYMKNNFYQIAAIGIERFSIGVPMITLPEGAGEKDYTRANDIVKNLRVNEASGIVLPNEKWKIDILVPKGKASGGSELKDSIEHHDLMILQAGLCAFLNLGTTDTGSFALSQDARGFFLTYVQDRMSGYVEELNKQVIERLLELNNMKPSKPIKVTFTNLGESDKTAMAAWLKTLVDAGMIKVDSKLMEWVTDNFGLPELTDEDKEMMDIAEIEKEAPVTAPVNEE